MKFIEQGFTLAEILIVLVVIGIITSILVPSAMHNLPNQNAMKFKKANATLYRVINELVNSDQYYLNGDLGIRANGQRITGKNSGDITYFCNTIADLISTKSVNCSETINRQYILNIGKDQWGTYQTIDEAKEHADNTCKEQTSAGNEIVSTDGITYYQVSPNFTFGITWRFAMEEYESFIECTLPGNENNPICSEEARLFSSPEHVWHSEENGFDRVYKIFCIDVDGIPDGGSENCDDVNDICPFGYGIRADGKIVTGARADEWIQKSIQEKE